MKSVANKPSDSMVMQRTGLEFRRYGAAPENTTLTLVSLNLIYTPPFLSLF